MRGLSMYAYSNLKLVRQLLILASLDLATMDQKNDHKFIRHKFGSNKVREDCKK